MKPVWIDRSTLLLLHGESLAEHGGAAGIRDEGLFESALTRPRHRFEYGKPDVHELAAAYGFGLAKDHPFVDGNKRAAFLATGLLLLLNGWTLNASQVDATQTILSLADGSTSEEIFANWLRANSSPPAKPRRRAASKRSLAPRKPGAKPSR